MMSPTPLHVNYALPYDVRPTAMKFIETTGKLLDEIISEGELHLPDLAAAGITENTIVRINQHGDIEVRRSDRWDVVGGLLGDFEERVQNITGLDWL